jgi:hypothetical protein
MHFLLCGFLVRLIRVPHKKSIAPAMPLIDAVDFQQVAQGKMRKWVAGGESLYRTGDKRLTCAGAGWPMARRPGMGEVISSKIMVCWPGNGWFRRES